MLLLFAACNDDAKVTCQKHSLLFGARASFTLVCHVVGAACGSRIARVP